MLDVQRCVKISSYRDSGNLNPTWVYIISTDYFIPCIMDIFKKVESFGDLMWVRHVYIPMV